jgi:hypothetical protein
MPAPPPQFRMPQRASTQLSINLQQQPMRINLNKNFGSSSDLKSPEIKSIERRQEKSRELKKGRAPPPPLTSQSNSRIKVKLRHVLIHETFCSISSNIFLDDATASNAGTRTTFVEIKKQRTDESTAFW